nr:hypothetical protein [Candidatus Omnitrophota bacterium]
MKILVEEVDSILAREAGKALPEKCETGKVEFVISDLWTQEVCIVSTLGRYGGFLRWFICPGCNQRVGKLYLPIGNHAFLCRHCYKLGYRAQFIRDCRKTSNNKEKTKRQNRLEILKQLQEMLKGRKRKTNRKEMI